MLGSPANRGAVGRAPAGTRRRPRAVIVALAAAMVLSLLAAVAPSAEARTVTSEDIKRTINWRACHEDITEETGLIVECAKMRVPLDYDRPFGSTLQIELVRLPATDQENRMGAILLNPGGPGGSGIDFALGFGPAIGFVLGEEIPQKFDIVGFDPRGINRSSPVRCFSNLDQAFASTPPIGFPLTMFEESLFEDSNKELARSCRRRGQARRTGSHASTTNAARDMDLIRASMGDEYLNFLGLSYGSYLGNVYANLFPDKVRSVVIDGVLDPIAWVNEAEEQPFSTLLRSDKGAADTLDEFFRQCDAAAEGNCALAPNSAERYAAVADRLLEEGSLTFIDPDFGDEVTITYQDLIGFTLGNLYSPPGYPGLAGIVAFLEQELSPAELGVAMAGAESPFMRERYINAVEGFPAVGCVDTGNPTTTEAWSAAGASADEEFGYFGRLWTWASFPCKDWPFVDRDRYEGPFDNETANPVLVIGNFYDPATRYEGAQIARSLLPNSGLLSVDVPGHTSLGISGCAGFITGQYFLDPNVATDVDGFVCPQEFNVFDLFGGPPPGEVNGAGSADMASVRDTVMDQVGLVPPQVMTSSIGS